MKSVFRSNLFALLLIVLQIFVGIFLAGPLTKVLGFENLLMLDEYIFLLIPALIFIAFNGEPIKRVLKLNRLPIIQAIIVILIAFLAQPVASFLSYFTSLFFQNPVEEAFNKLAATPYLTMIFMIAVTPAICEEVVARGVFLNGYNKKSALKAALINGLFFGILHLNPQQFLYTFVLGVLFAYLVRITNSIWASALCHFVFNGIQVTLVKFAGNTDNTASVVEDSVTPSLYETMMTLTTLLVAAVVFAMIIILLLKYLDSRHKKAANMLKGEETSNSYGNDGHIGVDCVEGYKGEVTSYRNYEEETSMSSIWAYIPLILLVVLFIGLMLILYIV